MGLPELTSTKWIAWEPTPSGLTPLARGDPIVTVPARPTPLFADIAADVLRRSAETGCGLFADRLGKPLLVEGTPLGSARPSWRAPWRRPLDPVWSG